MRRQTEGSRSLPFTTLFDAVCLMRRGLTRYFATILCAVFIVGTTWANSEDSLVYEIRVVRNRVDPKADGIYGSITVQGEFLGPSVERLSKAIVAGSYSGKLRYDSGKGFAVGQLPSGIASITTKGDFLIEVKNAKGRDGSPKSAVLFHNGRKPANSEGCILVGGPSKNGVLPADHPLVKMRRLYCGDLPEGNPLFADVKQIHIVIVDPPSNPRSFET
jgi:hypothetical protein